jgi:diguanylate cyclase (GGDEF)-like protein
MLAGFTKLSPRGKRRSLLGIACLAGVLACAHAQQTAPAVSLPVGVPSAPHIPSPLDARLETLREIQRFVPKKAIPLLLEIEQQARAAPTFTKTNFLFMLSGARLGVGQKQEAFAIGEELYLFGLAQKDNRTMAKGQLAKAYAAFDLNRLAESHQFAWDAERLANLSDDVPLRVTAMIGSSQSYGEEGNFPPALAKMQEAVALARVHQDPITLVIALNSLAGLYGTMKEFDRGFEALDEAFKLAEKRASPGRMVTLKSTEHILASDTNQPQRALKALLSSLELARQINWDSMVTSALVNLSDAYLQQRDFARTIDFGNQAIAAAQLLNDTSSVATARINIGQAYMGMGRVAEGKRSFEAGLAWYEQSGDKPELQLVLKEFGAVLERAGDHKGAVEAYHRERALSSELFEKQRQKAIWELQEKYETEKKQRQIELLSRENLVKSTELVNRRLQQRVWWLLALVFALASMVVGLLYRKVRQANAQLEVKNLELKQQSSRDPLTALYNRRHFQEFMRTHMQVEKRGSGTSGEEIVGALFLLDIDHFKHVNDTYGHAAGDLVLKMIAENLREILRETDMIVRWGGEEFLAFLPAIPRSGVEEIARRLLVGITAQTITYQGRDITVNVSIGFAPFPLSPGEHPLPWERAVNLVDMALYLAKAHGRNRAYGVRGFANFAQTSMEDIEQDLERAWRSGFVDLSITLGTNHDTNEPEVARIG